MAQGPGKYDDIATMVMAAAQAEGCIVIVWNGKYGAGFSAQFADPVLMGNIPQMLRNVADQMEQDVKELETGKEYVVRHRHNSLYWQGGNNWGNLKSALIFNSDERHGLNGIQKIKLPLDGVWNTYSILP